MIYETFNPEKHDIYKIAKYIYDVDFRTFDMLFKSEDDAVRTIAHDLTKRKISPHLMAIFDDERDLVGMLMVHTHEDSYDFRLKSLRLIIVDILDHFVLCDINEEDFYIAEIAIDESQRGKGLGRTVIADAIEYAKSNNYKRVLIDADFRNTGARSLYERIGFKEFNKKRVKIGSFERGMHNMELNL